MKAKPLLLISICLNLILAGWVGLLLHKPAGFSNGASAAVTPKSTTAPAEQSGPANVAHGLTESPGSAQFDWRQVESEDYRRYLANLRAIGCPEKTIKDIIVADVNDLFSSRMASLTKTNHYEYWRKEPLNRSKDQVKQLQDLYAQKREALKALGVDAPDFTDLLGEVFRDNLEERDHQLAFLPEFKRQQIKETLFQQAQQEVANGNDVARSEAIEQQTQTRIQSLLTSEEFKEYELRSSTDALQLRGVLDPLTLTEQEFRAIFDSWRSLKALNSGTEEYRGARGTIEKSLQQLLGPDRFQLYVEAIKPLGY